MKKDLLIETNASFTTLKIIEKKSKKLNGTLDEIYGVTVLENSLSDVENQNVLGQILFEFFFIFLFFSIYIRSAPLQLFRRF